MNKLLLLLGSFYLVHLLSPFKITAQESLPNLAFSGWDQTGPEYQISIVVLENSGFFDNYLITDYAYDVSTGTFESPSSTSGDIYLNITGLSGGLQKGDVVVIKINILTSEISVNGTNAVATEFFPSGDLTDLEFTQDETLYLMPVSGFAPFTPTTPPSRIFSVLNMSPDPIADSDNPNLNTLAGHQSALVIDLDPEASTKGVDFKKTERFDPTVESMKDPENWITSTSDMNLSDQLFFAPLPVELVGFSAEKTESGINISWETSSELENEGFELERSQDGIHWDLLSFIQGAGTTTQSQTYQYLDDQLTSGNYFYRLKQLDYDGKSTFSDVLVVNWGEINSFEARVYPNPTTDQIYFANTFTREPAEISIYNGAGTLVLEQALIDESIDVSEFPAGIYRIRVLVNGELQFLTFAKN